MPTPGQELASVDFDSLLGGPLIAAVNAQAQAALSTVNFLKEVCFKTVATNQDPTNAITGDPIYVTFTYPQEVTPYQPAIPATIVLTLTNGGSGYTSAPTVTISGGGGTGAAATASVSAGVITGLTLTSPGSGYSATATPAISVTISAPPTPATGAAGTQATASASISPAVPAVPATFQQMQLQVPLLTLLYIPSFAVQSMTINFNAKINSIVYKQVDTSLNVSGSLSAKANWGWGSAQLNVSASYQTSTQQGSSVNRTYSMAVQLQAGVAEPPLGLQKILDILEARIAAQPASVAQPLPATLPPTPAANLPSGSPST